jgi:hypothetical protein
MVAVDGVIPPYTTDGIFARCPSGAVALGGGYEYDGSMNIGVDLTRPQGYAPGIPYAWLTHFRNGNDRANDVTVYVICMDL